MCGEAAADGWLPRGDFAEANLGDLLGEPSVVSSVKSSVVSSVKSSVRVADTEFADPLGEFVRVVERQTLLRREVAALERRRMALLQRLAADGMSLLVVARAVAKPLGLSLSLADSLRLRARLRQQLSRYRRR